VDVVTKRKIHAPPGNLNPAERFEVLGAEKVQDVVFCTATPCSVKTTTRNPVVLPVVILSTYLGTLLWAFERVSIDMKLDTDHLSIFVCFFNLTVLEGKSNSHIINNVKVTNEVT
jgi:hypothetical protein